MKAPAVVYLYAKDRKGEHPAAHLAEFQGVLQVDGYSGFKRLLAGRPPDPRSSSPPCKASPLTVGRQSHSLSLVAKEFCNSRSKI